MSSDGQRQTIMLEALIYLAVVGLALGLIMTAMR